MSLPVYKAGGKPRLSTVLKYELNPQFTREEFTLLAGDGAERNVQVSQLLAEKDGTEDADGIKKKVAWDPTASDGSEVIWGLNLLEVTAANGTDNGQGSGLVRGPAIINPQEIVWPDAITDEQKTAAIAALKEHQIVSR